MLHTRIAHSSRDIIFFIFVSSFKFVGNLPKFPQLVSDILYYFIMVYIVCQLAIFRSYDGQFGYYPANLPGA